MLKKLLIGFAVFLLAGISGIIIFLVFRKPVQRPPWPEKIAASEVLIERGRYLSHHVAMCVDCHSDRHQDRYGFPPRLDVLGAGSSVCWDESMGYPGFKVCSSNLTPAGLGDWSDGEIMRAIREGVDKHGNALFPVMPYMEYRHMSDDDVRAIVAYLRTLPPIVREKPERELPTMLKIVVKFMPRPLEGDVHGPDPGDPVARGQYLSVIAGCRFCHTPVDAKHRPLTDQESSGGQRFPLPNGQWVYSANLTPHETGLAGRSRDEFIALFRSFASPAVRDTVVDPADNTLMPWQAYAGMTDEDLGAIHSYLTSLAPIERVVDKLSRPAGLAAQPAADAATDGLPP